MAVWNEENAAHLLSRAGFGGDMKEHVKYAKLPQSIAVDLLMKLVCLPAEGTSPCDGVTSTFDQIPRTIFTPVSCARSTCHDTAQEPHDMSLAPGEAHSYLVGVPPTNLAAQSAGKLRVDPGNPENSFILDKLHGTLEPGEGEPMPLQLKRLPDNAIRLVEEWIAAGAPSSGFVAPSGCPGP